MRWLGACVRWVGFRGVFKLLALCHALSVYPVDNLLVLASVTLIERATHKDQETCNLKLDFFSGHQNFRLRYCVS